MAEDEKQQSSDEDKSADEGSDKGTDSQDDGSGESTPIEIEAYWKKRQSNSDKAHSAASKVMQTRLDVLEAKGTESANTGDDSQAKASIEAANKRADEAEAKTNAAELAAKYPNAVKAVGRASIAMDEAALASLDATLDFDAKAPRITDSNNPARKTGEGGKKSYDDMSLKELQDHFTPENVPYEG